MLTKKEIKEIRERFTRSRMDRPVRLEGEHLKQGDQTIPLGWNVLSSKGHGIKLEEREYDVQYASNTTFEAATFLVHLPVDMANLLVTVEDMYKVLEKVKTAADSPEVYEIVSEILEDYKWGSPELNKSG